MKGERAVRGAAREGAARAGHERVGGRAREERRGEGKGRQ